MSLDELNENVIKYFKRRSRELLGHPSGYLVGVSIAWEDTKRYAEKLLKELI